MSSHLLIGISILLDLSIRRRGGSTAGHGSINRCYPGMSSFRCCCSATVAVAVMAFTNVGPWLHCDGGATPIQCEGYRRQASSVYTQMMLGQGASASVFIAPPGLV